MAQEEHPIYLEEPRLSGRRDIEIHDQSTE